MTPERLEAARRKAVAALLAELPPEGHWRGELSASALSTATAVVALVSMNRERHAGLIAGGLRWLAAHRNVDGGWGDTVRSRSNISTTALVWAAYGAAGADAEYPAETAGAAARLRSFCGGGELTPERLARAIGDRYGKDRTFSVPILLTCALAGRLGPDGWSLVLALPFELAALPHQLFGALRMPVVSYALPALIAIGHAVHHQRGRRNLLRRLAERRTLRVLEEIQPPHGGYLEATPLTSFVVMSLAAAGQGAQRAAVRGVTFLTQAVRADGSWPIDTDLATWVTTLSIKALEHDPQVLSPEQRLTLREWLLGQQYRTVHPYTHAPPGGWAWTDLPGGVPDADDTAGALLALLRLGALTSETAQAGQAGLRWLCGLQNRDGGIPTFCRGWGALPFDRSSPDLTAHALRAWSAWHLHLPALRPELERALRRGLGYLGRTQRADGAWVPLWFGNEHAENDENPLYGTAQVLIALRELRGRGWAHSRAWDERGVAWLLRAQQPEGAWSAAPEGAPSIEETALALRALASSAEGGAACARGLAWLVEQVESGAWREPAPLGFYFARLWYFEKLYPLLHTVEALGAHSPME